MARRPRSPLAWLVAATLVVGAAGCSLVTRRATRLEVIAVDQLRVTEVRGGRAHLELALRVQTHAPVDATATVRRFDVRLEPDGRVLASGGPLPPLAIPSGGQVALTLPLDVGLGDLPADLPDRLAAGPLRYRAVVQVDIASRAGMQSHVLTPAGPAPLGDRFETIIDAAFGPDAARVKAVWPRRLTRGGLRLAASVWFPGHLPFPVRVRRATYTIWVAAGEVGRGASEGGFVVEPRRGGTAELIVDVPPLAGPALLAALAAGVDTVVVEGVVEIEPIGPIRRLPFRAQMPLRR